MSARAQYALVVDTSVARSASTSDYPTAIHCRETLATMDSEGYALAMSDPLWDEWNRTVAGRPTGSWDTYASQYTMRWFVTMQSRDRVVWKDLPEPDPLHERVMKVAYAIYPLESHAPENWTKIGC